MASREPTFYRLDERTGRRTAAVDGVAVDPGLGLVLTADPTGPLGLASSGGSLGGLRLPRGIALDRRGLVYLLVGSSVRRFDPERGGFVPLAGLGGVGSGPRELRAPRDLAVAGDNLYVADSGNGRVQVFDLATWALVHLWPAASGQGWLPWAVASRGATAFVLDREHGRVLRHRAGTEPLEVVVDRPEAAGVFGGIAVDRSARIYLLREDGAQPVLEVFEPDGRSAGRVADAGQVRSRFDPPPIRADHLGRFCLPASLARRCDRRLPDPPPPPDDPLGRCRGRGATGLLFDRRGRPARFDPEQPPGPPVYLRRGTWLSTALDSRIHRCQWHRVDLQVRSLPPGARVAVSTLTSDTELAPGDVAAAAEDRWLTRFAVVGALQPPPEEDGSGGRPREEEVLVQSRQGRYLWLRVELSGDGYASPAVGDIEVHFPRRSGLDFLPALYSVDEESRWFLERFLAIVEREWDAVGARIETLRRLFDPQAVPDAFVPFLADWLALPLEQGWTAEQQRRLLSAAPGYYPQRGTAEGLRRVLQTYLWNMTGLPPETQGELPVVVEGFRERRHVLLASEGTARLGHTGPLWSRSYVGRLQLGVFSRAGEVRLVSTGDPELDLFHRYAHRFRVFVPAGWLRSDDDETMLRRAIDAEKPAHTLYDLCLVEPRLRVGVQSTVGLDTVLGDYAPIRLTCAERSTARRVPRHRLGIDAVLGRAPGPAGALSLGDRDRVGVHTRLM